MIEHMYTHPSRLSSSSLSLYSRAEKKREKWTGEHTYLSPACCTHLLSRNEQCCCCVGPGRCWKKQNVWESRFSVSFNHLFFARSYLLPPARLCYRAAETVAGLLLALIILMIFSTAGTIARIGETHTHNPEREREKGHRPFPVVKKIKEKQSRRDGQGIW